MSQLFQRWNITENNRSQTDFSLRSVSGTIYALKLLHRKCGISHHKKQTVFPSLWVNLNLEKLMAVLFCATHSLVRYSFIYLSLIDLTALFRLFQFIYLCLLFLLFFVHITFSMLVHTHTHHIHIYRESAQWLNRAIFIQD